MLLLEWGSRKLGVVVNKSPILSSKSKLVSDQSTPETQKISLNIVPPSPEIVSSDVRVSCPSLSQDLEPVDFLEWGSLVFPLKLKESSWRNSAEPGSI